MVQVELLVPVVVVVVQELVVQVLLDQAVQVVQMDSQIHFLIIKQKIIQQAETQVQDT